MKNFLRALSIAMVLALLVQIMPMSTIADAIAAVDETATATTDNPITGECVDQRDEYTKVFERKDGSKIAVISPEAIHYEKDGKMVDIDNTMVESGKIGSKVLKNKDNPLGVELPKTLNEDKEIKVTNEGYNLSFKFIQDLDSASAHVEKQKDVKADKDNISEQAYEKTDLEKKSSEITYSEIMDDVDVEYVVQAEKLKENIILKEKPTEDVVFSYSINAPKLTAVVNKDNSINFYAGSNKKDVKFCLPAPVMFDSNSTSSGDIKVELNKAADGTYTMAYRPSMAWLNNSGLEYPVTVDPVVRISANSSSIDDSYVSSSNPTTNYGSGTDMFMQYNNKIPLLRIKMFGVGNVSNAVITKANVYLYNKTVNGTGSCSVAVKEITAGSSWTESGVTWNDYAAMTKGCVVDSNVVNLSAAGFVGWDITTLIKHQFATYGTFNGMVFDAASSTAQDVQFASKNCTTSAQRPYCTIEYRNLQGISSGTDNHTQDIGRAGTGYVNDVYGALSFARTDMSFSSTPIDMTFYNNYSGDINSGITFTSKYSESITYYNYSIAEQPAYYILNLADGSTRYLDITPLPDGHGALATGEQYVVDEQLGAAYIIFQEIDTDGYRYYKLTDDTSTCSKYYKTNDTSTSTEKSLYKIENLSDDDTVSDSININIDLSTGDINNIIDSRGYKYVFNYANYTLSSVSYYGTGTTALSTVNYSIASNGNLTVTYPDSKQVKYERNTVTTNLFKVSNTDGRGMEYTIASGFGGRKYVTKIQEVATDGTYGNYINITYGVNQTIFEDNSGNKQVENFDQYGNTISTRDKDGNAVFSAYGGNSGKGNNLLIGESNPRRPTENILENGGFEFTNETCPISIQNPNEGVVPTPFYLGTDDNPAYAGNYCYKVSTPSGSTVQELSKTVTGLIAGKEYTFSIWIKTVGDNASARIYCSDGNGEGRVMITNGDWQCIQVNDEMGQGDMTLHVSLYGEGEFYIDDMQLEQANPANPFNFVENSDFTDGGNHWTDSTNSIGNQTTTFTGDSTGTPAKLDTNRRKLAGVVDREITSYQRIPIKGKTGETYSFGGWACAEALPKSETNGRSLSIAVVIPSDITGDEEKQLARIEYNTYITNWQFQESSFTLTEDCPAILIKLIYTNELNSAYFDGVEFFKDALYKDFNQASDITTNSQLLNNIMGTGNDYGSGVTYGNEKDNYGNITRSYTSNGLSSIGTTNTYSANGNYLNSLTNELGNTTQYSHNEQFGTLTSVEDAKNNIVNYVYNAMQQNTNASQTVTNPYFGVNSLSLSNTYAYNNGDSLSQINTGNGIQYEFTYDKWGNPSTVKAGNTTLATYEYSDDAERSLTTITYANGQAFAYVKNFDGEGNDLIGLTDSEDLASYWEIDNTDFGVPFAMTSDMADGYSGQYFLFGDGITEERLVTDPTIIIHSYGSNNTSDGTEFLEKIGSTGIKSTYKNNDGSRSKIATFAINNDESEPVNHEDKYDEFGRLLADGTYQGITGDTAEKSAIMNNYTYKNLPGCKTSNQVASMSISRATDSNLFYKDYRYYYDAIGNITDVYNGDNVLAHYEYDEASQLIRVNDAQQNKTFTYKYDANGNMLLKWEYAFTTGALGTLIHEYVYTYDTTWKDKLTSYDGKAITCDALGNPSTYDGWTYTWQGGRELQSMNKTGVGSLTFDYDSNGIRLIKTVNGIDTKFTVVGSKITHQQTGSDNIYYYYDESDNIVSLNYAGNDYFYVKNLQGDIIAITDVDGNIVVEYTYDAWGKLLSTTGSLASTLGVANPFRYRSYYYDTETGLYYLQSRYYSPETGRFISTDTTDVLELSLGQVLNANLSVYCNSNVVNKSDPTGYWGADVHHGKGDNNEGYDGTYQWARQCGFIDAEATIIADADNYVDNNEETGPMPNQGQQYHFNMNKTGEDSRITIYKERKNFAVKTWNDAKKVYNNSNKTKTDRTKYMDAQEKALKAIGTGLHPLQDIDAHGNFGKNHKGDNINVWHGPFMDSVQYDWEDAGLIDLKKTSNPKVNGVRLGNRYFSSRDNTKKYLNDFRGKVGLSIVNQ